ncbi:hypothetical protein PGB90_003211 [Kerria lacca]
MSVFFSKMYKPMIGISSQFFKRSNINYQKTIRRYKTSLSRGVGKPSITWRSFIITTVFTGGLVYWVNLLREEKQKRENIERNRRIGKAAIGGPFELVDSDNTLRTSESFKGEWLLIYFGFTHCPDICPDEIEKMVKTVDIIDKNELVPNIQPIFISVDPDRDTPEVVGKYIKEYSPKFIGLTGNKEQVDKVCKAYRVYYSAGPQDEDKDYIVDHTIIIYLINPDGEFVDYYGQTRNAEEVANGIIFQMIKYEKLNKSSSLRFSSILKNSSNVQGN